MRWLGFGSLMLVVLVQHPLRAQEVTPAVTPAALVGTWQGIPGWDPKTAIDPTGHLAPHLVVFRPDSTFTETWATYDGGQRICTQGRWTRLAGDTITWAADGSYKVLLRQRELIFYLPVGNRPEGQRIAWASTRLVEPAEAYQRVDSATVAPALLAGCTAEGAP